MRLVIAVSGLLAVGYGMRVADKDAAKASGVKYRRGWCKWPMGKKAEMCTSDKSDMMGYKSMVPKKFGGGWCYCDATAWSRGDACGDYKATCGEVAAFRAAHSIDLDDDAGTTHATYREKCESNCDIWHDKNAEKEKADNKKACKLMRCRAYNWLHEDDAAIPLVHNFHDKCSMALCIGSGNTGGVDGDKVGDGKQWAAINCWKHLKAGNFETSNEDKKGCFSKSEIDDLNTNVGELVDQLSDVSKGAGSNLECCVNLVKEDVGTRLPSDCTANVKGDATVVNDVDLFAKYSHRTDAPCKKQVLKFMSECTDTGCESASERQNYFQVGTKRAGKNGKEAIRNARVRVKAVEKKVEDSVKNRKLFAKSKGTKGTRPAKRPDVTGDAAKKSGTAPKTKKEKKDAKG